MKPAQLYKSHFNSEALSKIFEDRISHSSVTGKDGISPAAFREILAPEISLILHKISANKYKFTNYKQKLVLKGARKPPREISIATVRDRIVLRSITNILMNVFSDRKSPAPHHFIKELSDLIKPLGDEYSFVQIDIKDFYPSIIHSEMAKRLRSRIRTPELIELVLSAIRTPTGDTKKGATCSAGVPQGLSVSNILSAIYMTNFDNMMKERHSYFRYVDDIVIVCSTSSASKVHAFAAAQLKRIGLISHELAPNSKTKIVPVSQGIDYLGYSLRPGGISVRISSYRRMMDNIMAVITSAKDTVNSKRILLRLNIKITGCIFNDKRMGWMFFFSMTTDIAQLKRLDEFVSTKWKTAGMEKFGKPKRFVKSYYEIRYNMNATNYVPKFDEYTKQQKVKLIADMENKSVDEVRGWTEERIDRIFLRLVRKEVADLERDVTPVS